MSRNETTAGQESLQNVAISETGFVFDPGTGLTFQANRTGKWILRRLQEGASVPEIEKEIRRAFQVRGQDLRRDILEFISVMKEHDLLMSGGRESS